MIATVGKEGRQLETHRKLAICREQPLQENQLIAEEVGDRGCRHPPEELLPRVSSRLLRRAGRFATHLGGCLDVGLSRVCHGVPHIFHEHKPHTPAHMRARTSLQIHRFFLAILLRALLSPWGTVKRATGLYRKSSASESQKQVRSSLGESTILTVHRSGMVRNAQTSTRQVEELWLPFLFDRCLAFGVRMA